MSAFDHESDLAGTDAAWEYAYSYFFRRKGSEDRLILTVCIGALLIGIGTTICTLNFQGELEQYLAIVGPGIVAYFVSAIFLFLHHRLDCRARAFACEVADSNVFDKADIRALYRAWQP